MSENTRNISDFSNNQNQVNIANDNSIINANYEEYNKYNITGGNIGYIGDLGKDKRKRR